MIGACCAARQTKSLLTQYNTLKYPTKTQELRAKTQTRFRRMMPNIHQGKSEENPQWEKYSVKNPTENQLQRHNTKHHTKQCPGKTPLHIHLHHSQKKICHKYLRKNKLGGEGGQNMNGLTSSQVHKSN